MKIKSDRKGRKCKQKCAAEIESRESNNCKKSKLRAPYLNARGICNKIDELTAPIEINEHDLIAITVMWLLGDWDWELHIPNYLLFHKDRLKGGGGMLIKDSICGQINERVQSV